MRTTSHSATGLQAPVTLHVLRRFRELIPTWKGTDIAWTTQLSDAPISVVVDVLPGGYAVHRTRFTELELRVVLKEGGWSEAVELAEHIAFHADKLGGYASTDTDNRITYAVVTETPSAYEVPPEAGEPLYQAALTLEVRTRALDNPTIP